MGSSFLGSSFVSSYPGTSTLEGPGIRLIIKQTHKFGLLIFLLFFGFDRKWLRRVFEEPQDIGLRTGMCLKSTVD